ADAGAIPRRRAAERARPLVLPHSRQPAGDRALLRRHGPDADVPVLRLPAVALDADGARRRDLECGLDDLAVARDLGDAAAHGDGQFVPVLRLVAREVRVRPRPAVVAHLQLLPAQVAPAVGKRRGPELELQHEVLAELALRPP